MWRMGVKKAPPSSQPLTHCLAKKEALSNICLLRHKTARNALSACLLMPNSVYVMAFQLQLPLSLFISEKPHVCCGTFTTEPRAAQSQAGLLGPTYIYGHFSSHWGSFFFQIYCPYMSCLDGSCPRVRNLSTPCMCTVFSRCSVIVAWGYHYHILSNKISTFRQTICKSGDESCSSRSSGRWDLCFYFVIL